MQCCSNTATAGSMQLHSLSLDYALPPTAADAAPTAAAAAPTAAAAAAAAAAVVAAAAAAATTAGVLSCCEVC